MIKYEKYAAGFSGRALTRLAFIASSGLLLLSCTHGNPSPGPDSGVDVRFTVSLPGLSDPVPTRQQTPSEMRVSTLTILVFESTGGGDFLFDYGVRAADVSQEGAQTFRARLRGTTNPLRFIVAANADQIFESYIPPVGTTEEQVRQDLELLFSEAGITGDLPMYGEAGLPGGLNTGAANNISVTLLRAIARIDVKRDLEQDSPDFTLTEVNVFRANNSIKLIPNGLAEGDTPRVVAPSIPGGASMLTSPVTKTAAEGADEIIQLYIPESEAVPENENRLTGATVVVVGGRFADDTQTSYYRADIDPDGTTGLFGQVLRNHHYVFNIKKVTATGWPTPQDAANNYASALVVTVQAWEDFASDMNFGENRFAVSSRSIALPFVRDRERSIDVQSTVPYQIQWLDADGEPEGTPASGPGVTISNARFDVRIEATGDEDVTRLVFRTLANNHTGEIVNNRLRVMVENWTVDIAVSQDNTAMYSTRKFNVMSAYHSGFAVTPAGHLGTTSVLPQTSYWTIFGGLAMRMILDYNFISTAGRTIRIGGFAFDQLTDDTAYFGATTDANVTNMTRIVGVQDVIYLSYDVRLSAQMAPVILAWLESSPRRVLILGMDSADSNAAMRNLLLGTNSGWSFGITANNFVRAVESTQTGDFFEGPFGQVPVNAPITRQDGYAGYCASPSASVTRLIESTNNGMVFGVDKQGRIIYHGDANFFLSPPMNNNTGMVTDNLDRLMANTWAWIVEQLIYGGE